MNLPAIFKSLVSEIRQISNDFCDLVLGPLAIAQKSEGGQLIEIIVSEPEDLENYVDSILWEAKSVAILGVEASRFEGKKKAGSIYVMPAQNVSHVLFAAFELIKSDAFDLIVVQELLLSPGFTPQITEELHKLKGALGNAKTSLVLLNPNTSERKMILSELEILCSRQIFYKDLKLRRS